MDKFLCQKGSFVCTMCNSEIVTVKFKGETTEWELQNTNMLNPKTTKKKKIVLKCRCGNKENITDYVKIMSSWLVPVNF